MTPERREAIVQFLFYRALSAMGDALLKDDLQPYVANPASASLSYNPMLEMFYAGSVRKVGDQEVFTSFGVNVPH